MSDSGRQMHDGEVTYVSSDPMRWEVARDGWWLMLRHRPVVILIGDPDGGQNWDLLSAPLGVDRAANATFRGDGDAAKRWAEDYVFGGCPSRLDVALASARAAMDGLVAMKIARGAA